jgi:hypothetical protein
VALATSSPNFVAITLFRPLFLEVTSDFPQVLDFVLQGFNLKEDRRGWAGRAPCFHLQRRPVPLKQKKELRLPGQAWPGGEPAKPTKG